MADWLFLIAVTYILIMTASSEYGAWWSNFLLSIVAMSIIYSHKG